MIIIKYGVDNMKYKCSKCLHKWISRTEHKPKSCPQCKNYKWIENDEV